MRENTMTELLMYNQQNEKKKIKRNSLFSTKWANFS